MCARVAVVGGGIYGWSIALGLAGRGASATVIDPRPIDDADRASGGTTRVLRVEYGDAGVYTELTVRARERWREIERVTGTALYRETGVLFLIPDGDDGAWERSSLQVTRAHGVGGTELAAADVARRWPAIRPGGIAWAVVNPVGGYLWANRATAAVARLAADAGVDTLRATVAEAQADGVILDDGRRLDADVVILATGAWTRRLLAGTPIRRTRQVITYLDRGPADIPVFSDGAPFAIYGMPAHDGHGIKIASHDPGDEADPDDPAERRPRPGELDGALDYARRRFVFDGEPAVARTEVCFYALTPSEDPVVGVMGDGRVVCAGFSGHGFKYAPVLGAEVADLALGGAPSPAIAAIRARAARSG